MHRRIPVLIVSFALVLVVRSDQNPRCYMCTSLTHPGCDTDPDANNIKTDECTLNHMTDMQRIIQQHNDLRNISHIFDVDTAHIYSATSPMACAKMVLKVKGKEVIVRNCQTEKTETVDPCKAIERKFPHDITLEYCDMCKHNACNSSTIITSKFLLDLLLVLGTMVFATFYTDA
ncbi:uncharacterized protein LOC117607084 isoform X1 [Osmia lignaria lignaria]|uniref:uncharacterized protein LOC117607084 isoform X1 n=2 Tax=Osmia lignaria lignaria TaxID=1437193 RepID=UPI0014780BC6|nr:uncharacterized protein LOC117607084 isoform X1 [Osmia lignaria]